MKEVTMGQFSDLRWRGWKLRDAMQTLVNLGFEPPLPMKTEFETLQLMKVAVKIPCLICKRPVLHEMAVFDHDGKNPMPRAAVCGECNVASEDVVR